jgi:hypothetical protein
MGPRQVIQPKPTADPAGAEYEQEARLVGGSPLLPNPSSFLDKRLGADLINVWVHTEDEEAQLNPVVSAQAPTPSSETNLELGKHDRASSSSKPLLARKLTYVAQQTREQTPEARGDAVQRDPISSGQVKMPRWTISRPKGIKAIDTALAKLADKLANLPGALDDIKGLITDVLSAVAAFRASKDSGGKWDANVRALEDEVRQKETEIDDKIRDREQGVVTFGEFKRLEPDLEPYATRSMLSASEFRPSVLGSIGAPSVKAALTKPRGPNGELTQEAIDEMNEVQKGEIVSEKAAGERDVTFAGMGIGEIRSLMLAHKNALTNETMYPELRNITDPLDPSTNPDNVTTTDVAISGVTMQVEHNQSDVNFVARLKLVQDAVAKIASKGITVPALEIHMPKYGRGLRLKAGTGASGQPGCEITNKSSRAVFIPPNFMHLSSEVIGTPDLTRVTNPATKAEEYKFSSTGFDPSGVATIVHEFGHALHYARAPGKFHGLWGTSFKKAGLATAISEVSQYGNKPREFVAEVFLGLMYDKAYSDQVLRMYKAFGGAIPPGLKAKFATP